MTIRCRYKVTFPNGELEYVIANHIKTTACGRIDFYLDGILELHAPMGSSAKRVPSDDFPSSSQEPSPSAS